MRSQPIRVLVVDDSPLIREMIGDALALHADITVVGAVGDGQQALKAVDELQPDIITLDLQMPRMDGLTTLDCLLKQRPTPVIVVSSLTQRAADVTMKALQQGALDYVAKPSGKTGMRQAFGEELPTKIRNMAGVDVQRILQYRKSREVRANAGRNPPDTLATAQLTGSCIALGVSTGGPPALAELFGTLVPPMPPIVVVQHMPRMFTGPFANRLNALSSLTVKEAAEGDVLAPNHVYVAPGGIHLSLRRVGRTAAVVLREGEFVSGHQPSVDVMMQSAAEIFGSRCLGVIMTGMGRDGANGCGAILAAGGYVIGQNEASSDVYGMNKVAFLEGHVSRQIGLDKLPEIMMDEAAKRCTGNHTLQPV